LGEVGAINNQVIGNTVPRYESAAFSDVAGWAKNILLSQDLIDTRAINATVHRLGVGTGGAVFFNVAGTDVWRASVSEIRPETDIGMSLGLINRRWADVHAQRYNAGPAGSTVKVVGSRVTGWTAATGTPTRTTFATSTVTTAQLAERVKALIDDLISHGLIGA
jgi:hypothetical protein